MKTNLKSVVPANSIKTGQAFTVDGVLCVAVTYELKPYIFIVDDDRVYQSPLEDWSDDITVCLLKIEMQVKWPIDPNYDTFVYAKDYKPGITFGHPGRLFSIVDGQNDKLCIIDWRTFSISKFDRGNSNWMDCIRSLNVTFCEND